MKSDDTDGSLEVWEKATKPPRKSRTFLLEQARAKQQDKQQRLRSAAADFLGGKFSSLHQAAVTYGVEYSTLHKGLMKNGGEFKGSRHFSS